MALLTVHPTEIDEGIAGEVASHTNRRAEHIAGAVTWGADEHMLLALAAVGWLCTRGLGKCERRLGTHFFCLLSRLDRPDAHIKTIDQSGTSGPSND